MEIPTQQGLPDSVGSVTVTAGPCPHRESAIPATGMLLGRRAGVDLDLFADPAVSRHHARLVWHSDGSLSVADAGSSNGTYLNGVRVQTPQAVTSGDIIKIGSTKLLIHIFPSPAHSAAQVVKRAAGVAGVPRAGKPDDWPGELAGRLFALPARWGWQATGEPVPVTRSTDPVSPRPVWIEPPSPDTGALHGARSKAVSRLIRRVAFVVVAVAAFASFRLVIDQKLSEQNSSAQRIFWIALVVVAVVLVLGVVRAVGEVRRASGAIRSFEQPYRVLRAAERQRHEQALRDGSTAVRRNQQESAGRAPGGAPGRRPVVVPGSSGVAAGPVDVLGGDPWRHGWASLLVTFGTSVLAAGHRITLLDFSGQDVGGGLVSVARVRGLPSTRVDLGEGAGVNLLDGVPAGEVAEALAYALTGQPEAGGDFRQERALATEMLELVLGCLDGGVAFGLAAGIAGCSGKARARRCSATRRSAWRRTSATWTRTSGPAAS